jgi:hypothetical protein
LWPVVAVSVSTVMMSSQMPPRRMAGPASRSLSRVAESYRKAWPSDQ